MASYGSGHRRDKRILVVEDLGSDNLGAALDALGLSLGEPDGPDEPAPAIRALWVGDSLLVHGAHSVANALAGWRSRHLGEDTVVVDVRSRITVARGGIDQELREDRLVVGPDGSSQLTPSEDHEPTFTEGIPPFPESMLDEALWDLFRSASSSAVAQNARSIDAGLSLIVPHDWAPPVSTGRVELGLGDDWRLLDGNALGVLLAHLKNNDRLDEASAPPDLGRWDRRAARRAGLDDVPERGTPEHARFHEVWSELTQRDRGAPGRDGRVAAWRFQTEGEWWLPGEECAVIAAELRTPKWVRDALDGLDEGVPVRVGPCT